MVKTGEMDWYWYGCRRDLESGAKTKRSFDAVVDVGEGSFLMSGVQSNT